MNVVVENRRISGDDRYSVPGVPGTPERRTEASREVPDILHPVMLKTDEGQLMIGVVGHRKAGWNWYSLFGGTEYYLRGKRSAVEAARELLATASGHKRKGKVGFHEGMPVQDNTPPVF
jgi:hypothetical protein